MFAPFWLTAPHASGEISVIDFESGSTCASKFVGGNIQIENSRGAICTTNGSGSNSVWNGTRFSRDVEELVVTQLDGQVFTPLSMSVAEYSLNVDPPMPLHVTGTKADGSEVTMEIAIDGERDGTDGIEDFQHVDFPASFAGIVHLEFGSGRWSLDDLVADAPATPPVTPGPRPRGFFRSAQKLTDPPSFFSATNANLFLLDDYVVQNSDEIAAVVDARNGALEVFHGPRSEIVDPVTFDFYLGGNEITRKPVGGGAQPVVDLAAIQALGYDATTLRPSAAYGGTLVFAGYNNFGPDHYYLFTYRVSDGLISPLVTPATELVSPPPAGGSTPAQFPRYETIGAGGIAFDTSIEDARSTTVIFEQAAGSMGFRILISEGDDTGFGNMSGATRLEYRGADLVVDVETDQGKTVRLVYRDGELSSSAEVTKSLPIAAEESLFIGDAEEEDPAAQIVTRGSTIYRCEGGLLHRVIGSFDQVAGALVQSTRYLATSLTDPDKILVFLFLTDPELNGYYEIEMGDPDPPAVELGKPFLWPDPELIYLPVNFATKGRVYTLYTSTDLATWTAHRHISDYEVRPRFWYRLADGEPQMHFRVEETTP